MADEYYELKLGVVSQGQFALCVFNYRIANPGSADDWLVADEFYQALDDGGATSFLNRFRNMMSTGAFVSSIRVRRVGPTGGNTAGQTFEATDFPGTIASPIHTQQIAACLIWVSETTPGQTGRNFIPGMAEISLDESRWSDAFKALAALFIEKFRTGISTASGVFVPVIFDRVAKTGPLINNGYLSPKVGTQRRRELPV